MHSWIVYKTDYSSCGFLCIRIGGNVVTDCNRDESFCFCWWWLPRLLYDMEVYFVRGLDWLVTRIGEEIN